MDSIGENRGKKPVESLRRGSLGQKEVVGAERKTEAILCVHIF